MIKEATHWAHYIEYTGWYPLCQIDCPALDYLSATVTRDLKKVTCHVCLEKLKEDCKCQQ